MSLTSFFNSVQVIALERSTERRARLPAAFAAIDSLDYHIFDAIDGSKLYIQELISNGTLKAREGGPNGGKLLNSGEIGCLMSHRAVWRQLLASEDDNVLVCEADIEWKESALSDLELFMNHAADWDMVYLHSHQSVEERPRPLVSGNCYDAHCESGGTLCYALNRRVAQFLLDLSDPMQYAADGVTNWASGDWEDGGKQQGFRSYLCYPFPCNSIGDESTVGHGLTRFGKFKQRIRRLLRALP